MENNKQLNREYISQTILSAAETEGGYATGELTPDADIQDVLGWDSLDRIDFINGIEYEFDIQFSMSEVDSFHTIQDIIETVCRKTKVN